MKIKIVKEKKPRAKLTAENFHIEVDPDDGSVQLWLKHPEGGEDCLVEVIVADLWNGSDTYYFESGLSSVPCPPRGYMIGAWNDDGDYKRIWWGSVSK